MIIKYVLPLVALGLLIFAVYHVTGGREPPTEVAPPAAPPRTPFANTVAGSGIVEPQTQNIAIGSPLPGVVAEVFVEVGQEVGAQAKLFRLDDRHEQAELAIRQADIDAAQAQLDRLKNQPREEELPAMQAQVARAKAALIDQQDQLKRIRPLVEKHVATEEDLVSRQQAVLMAQAELEQMQAQLTVLEAGAWEYDLAVAQAGVDQAESQAAQVRSELERHTVKTYVAGEVLQVNVRPGEFVGTPPGEPLIVLGNVKQLHARVDIDEYDIPRFRAGAPARAMLRGQSDLQFPLKFVRVEPYVVPKESLTGKNTERVDTRVLQVIYSINPGKHRLYVGQQLDVFIDSGPANIGGRSSR